MSVIGRTVLFRAIALAAALLAASGCTTAPEPSTESQLEWNDLKERGIDNGVEFAMALTSPPMAQQQVGYLALIDATGARFLKTGPHSDGAVVARDGEICVTSETTTYEVTTESAAKWDRGGYPGSGHWATLTADHGCVVVLNSGVGPRGYETDVYWGSGSAQQHSVVRDAPGPTGITNGAVWVRTASSSKIPGTIALYRTDLATGESVKFMSWPTHSEAAESGGPRVNFNDGYASNLFAHRGNLYYLEDLLTVSDKGEMKDFKPGVQAQLRLNEIDPLRETQTSTFLQYSETGLHQGDPGPNGSIATVAAMRGGHLHDGVLYTADTDGNIVAVDIESKSMSEVGQITPEAAKAVDAAAAWHGDQVTLLLADPDGRVTRQTYDLTTGKVLDSQPLDGFEDLMRGGLFLGNATRR